MRKGRFEKGEVRVEHGEVERDFGGEFVGVEGVADELGAVLAEGGAPDGGGDEAGCCAEEGALNRECQNIPCCIGMGKLLVGCVDTTRYSRRPRNLQSRGLVRDMSSC